MFGGAQRCLSLDRCSTVYTNATVLCGPTRRIEGRVELQVPSSQLPVASRALVFIGAVGRLLKYQLHDCDVRDTSIFDDAPFRLFSYFSIECSRYVCTCVLNMPLLLASILLHLHWTAPRRMMNLTYVLWVCAHSMLMLVLLMVVDSLRCVISTCSQRPQFT